MSSIVPESGQGRMKVPPRGDDAYLTRAEEEFIRRYLARPESFPPEFKRAILQWVALDGEPIPASQIQGGREGLWESFTPTWTSTNNPQPSLGNGVLGGRFSRTKKTVQFSIYFEVGSTTTLGAVAWLFSVPLPLTATFALAAATGYVSDASTGTAYAIGGALSNSGLAPVYGNTFFSPTSPIAWAAGDTCVISGTYESE